MAVNIEMEYFDGNSYQALRPKGDFSNMDGILTLDNPVFTGSVSMGRKAGTTVGLRSVAMGDNVEATNNYSFAEGQNSKSWSYGSHAEGNSMTNTDAIFSHAEGDGSVASGMRSHTEGWSCGAYGDNSHAEGEFTNAQGTNSHSEGDHTNANGYASHASGKCNKSMTSNKGGNDISGDAMAIGNGYFNLNTDKAYSNCFRVTFGGDVYGLSSFKSSGADYAEFFEWVDGNPNIEDRVGYFVTLQDKKIRLANSEDYILGVVSGQPCIIGNADEDWLGRWQHDEFGRFVLEYLEYEKTEISTTGMTEEEIVKLCMNLNVKKEDGKLYYITSKAVDYETSAWRYKVNSNYDSSQEYIERKNRPEWSAIGMLGVLSVRDDGSCQVNGFCKVTNNGIATIADNMENIKCYRVIERVSENVIKIIFR